MKASDPFLISCCRHQGQSRGEMTIRHLQFNSVEGSLCHPVLKLIRRSGCGCFTFPYWEWSWGQSRALSWIQFCQIELQVHISRTHTLGQPVDPPSPLPPLPSLLSPPSSSPAPNAEGFQNGSSKWCLLLLVLQLWVGPKARTLRSQIEMGKRSAWK